MKIAVVDHLGNAGGGSRFIRALLPALKAARPEAQITFFVNGVAFERENFAQEFEAAGIEVKKLRCQMLSNLKPFGIQEVGRFMRLLQQKYSSKLRFFPTFLSGAVHEEVRRITQGFDLAYFPWPFLMNCPQLDCPMVATFHDFNFRYYFTGASFHALSLESFNRETPIWLERSTPVVDTLYMKEEICKFYPQFGDKAKIIPMAPFSALSDIQPQDAERIVKEIGIQGDFLLYPCHLSPQKNIGSLLAAHSILKKRGHRILLVLTGPDTQLVTGRSCSIGLERDPNDKDVIGLGYVSNLQMDALIQCAQAVVTPSLYEAANGPGMDAWMKGTPVAMSNIPPYVEHLHTQDVRAAIFDPLSPADIADKIEFILKNRELALQDAKHSKEAIRQHTWLQAAEKYFKVFDEALSRAEVSK